MQRFGSLLWYLPVLVAIGWLATRFRIVLALFLIAHGLVHILYVVPEPEQKAGGPEWPFHLDQTWALPSAGSAAVRGLGILLLALTVAGFVLAGIALLANLGWWSGAAIAAAAASTALLGLFFHPLLVLGLAINVFVVSVAASIWPALTYAEV